MSVATRLEREWFFLRALVRTLWRVNSIAAASPNLACDDLERAVDRWRERPALSFEGVGLTYGQMDALANRYAHWADDAGLRRGDVVALIMPNRLEYLPIWYGLSKVGVATALINNQLTGEALAHCLVVSGATHCLVDEETWPAFEAARITHMRVQLYMRGFAAATGAKAEDRIFCALPLYHATGGICAVGAALLNGGTFVLARRFSASQFWDEVIATSSTMFVYIGELCRYLVNQPPGELDRQHAIRLVFGNGLRPDVWRKLRARFRIPEILEFYGSTEGNVSMFNFDGRVGAIGRAPGYLRKRFNVRLIRFDVEKEEPIRAANGLCLEARPGEVGECVGEIGLDARRNYTGYADTGATEKKVLRDVLKKGDAFFATGDLMRQDRDGYFYFVDRIGDTFRWKGENVSTTEVAERLSAVPGVHEATIYGVQVGKLDGRAGMASLVAGEDFDIKTLKDKLDAELPDYAQPMFVRLQPEIETTGTFKYRKMDLVAEGFSPDRIRGPLFYRSPQKGYVKLTKAAYDKIASGEVRL